MQELSSRGGSIESRIRTLEDVVNSTTTGGFQQQYQLANEQKRQAFYGYVLENTTDLLTTTSNATQSEQRHRIWRAYTQLVDGYAELLGQIRYHLFDLVLNQKTLVYDDDLPYIVDFLIAITDYGKCLHYYESKIDSFMIHLIDHCFREKTCKELRPKKKIDTAVRIKFLKFLINLIKYNAACLATSENQETLIKTIHFVCEMAFSSESLEELNLIYEFLNVVLSYSHLPSEVLSQFVSVLCVGFNNHETFSICNKIMKNLIGTYLGFACLNTLLYIIEDEINFSDKLLIRGAVHFLVQSLWGSLINEKVSICANSVLPAFRNLVSNETISNPLIGLEIAKGIQLFVTSIEDESKRFGHNRFDVRNVDFCISQEGLFDLRSKSVIYQYTWDQILEICRHLVKNHLLPSKDSNELFRELKATILNIIEFFEKVLNQFEESYKKSVPKSDVSFQNDQSSWGLFLNETFVEKVFNILEMAANYLTEESLCNLIVLRLNQIERQTLYDERLAKLQQMIDVYFVLNTNTSIRLYCLEKLSNFLEHSQNINIDGFWNEIASKYFIQPTEYRELALGFLIFFARHSRSTKNLGELIDIFDSTIQNRLKTIYRQHSVSESVSSFMFNSDQQHAPFLHQTSTPSDSSKSLEIYNDIILPVNGLIVILQENLDRAQCYSMAVQAFHFLIKTLSLIYKFHLSDDCRFHTVWARTLTLLKQKIFQTILSLRTNSMAQVGLVLANFSDFVSTHHFLSFNQENIIVRFTPYVLVKDVFSHNPNPISQASPPIINFAPENEFSSTSSMFFVSFYEAIMLCIECIKFENDQSVLQLMFNDLPKILKHKALILAAEAAATTSSDSNNIFSSSITQLSNSNGSIADKFMESLCHFIDNFQKRVNVLNHYLNGTHSDTAKNSKIDLLASIYYSISTLVSYKLLSSSQRSIIQCLQNGLVKFSAKISYIRQCIVSLTICLLEIPLVMNKYLQDIILSLSKITPNKALALPKLEFLSNVILFPDLYYTFSNKSYVSLFVIAQSYINPQKYGEYTVALALRVISMWFLKCPINCRISLIPFLIKGFQNHILKEIESNQIHHQRNSDSSQRNKQFENCRYSVTSPPPPPPSTPALSSTTTSCQTSQFAFPLQSFSRSSLEQVSTSSGGSAFNPCSVSSLFEVDSIILDPHDKENSKIELVEVCMDMIATNTFNTSSTLPFKTSMIDKLLNKEKTQFWLIGHKLIQITTTGCTSRAIRNGLCHKCYTVCHMNPATVSTENNGQNDSFNSNKWAEKLFTQHSYDADSTSNNSGTTNSIRRRHCSEMTQMSSNKKVGTTINRFHGTRFHDRVFSDDTFYNSNNLTTSSSDSELSSDNKNCRCFCQNWAEIVIRKATGTTRFILRIDNNLGDFPYWISSKDEDDSLVYIFENSDPELNLASKMIKSAISCQKFDSDENIVIDWNATSACNEMTPQDDSNSFKINSRLFQKNKNTSVARAASFGCRSTTTGSGQNLDLSFNHDSNHHIQSRLSERKLVKNPSFEEDNTPDGSRTSLELNAPMTENENVSPELLAQSTHRDRAHTVSGVSFIKQNLSTGSTHCGNICDSSTTSSNLSLSSRQTVLPAGGLSPQFVFLQLYYNSMFKEDSASSILEKPIQLNKNDALIRSIRNLDSVTPYETHKIGILYVGTGQTGDRSVILSNLMGSYRYARFLAEIGQLISLDQIDPKICYVGGLDIAQDGPYAISWGDHLVQMIFHVSTYMPTLPKDKNCNNKFTHIGNNFVCIVYNNSGETFDMKKINFGQVMLATIVITPLEYECNLVEIQGKKEFIEFLGHCENQVLSDQALPIYVRQLALHANLGAMVCNPNKNLPKSYNVSNWVSRLRNIKRIQKRAQEQQQQSQNGSDPIHSIRSSSLSHSQHKSRQSQSSKDEDNLVSPSTITNGSVFEYEPLNNQNILRLLIPDFSDYAKE